MKHTFKLTAIIAVLVLTFLPGSTLARYRPGLDWHTIRTDRVTIYYPRGHEQFAQRVLALTDEVTGDINNYLGVSPRRCPIVLNPDTDLFNGFYEPFPSRISLYETPPYSLRWFGPVSDVIDQVYTHEYAHFAHITTRLGWYGTLTRFIGDGLSLADGLSPGWLIEGIAVQTETMFTDGGRGRSPLFDGQVRSFGDGEGFWGLSASMSASPYHPPVARIYQAGYYMTDYLIRTYGDHAVSNLIQHQARHPVGGLKSALRYVTGQLPDAFYRAYLADLYGRIDMVQKRIASASLPAGQIVLADPLDSYNAHVWTGRGTVIALRSGYDRPDALIEINPATGDILSESKPGRLDRSGTFRRTSDGRLVYGRYFLHPLGGGDIVETDLGTFDPSTGDFKRITHGEHIFAADLSPDGSRFIATRRNGMWIDLVLVSAEGDSIRPLISKTGLLFEAPCWSPDGTMIAVVAKVNGNADIVLVNPDDGSVVSLFASDIHEDSEPAFSPDGRWIVFSSDRAGSWDIYAWNLSDKCLYRLTAVPYVAGNPQVSPDGTILSFTSLMSGVEQLCVIPFKPERGEQVTVEAGSALPAPDLERVAPDIPFKSEGIPFLEAYRPFVHAPWFGFDEDGVKLGIKLMGADPMLISSYNVNILYGAASGRPGYDVTVRNQSFWPELTAHLYDNAEEGNAIGGGRSYWYRERGGELSASLNVIHRTAPDIVSSYISIGGRYRSFEGLDGITIDSDADRSVAVFGAFAISRTPDYALRDLVPGWGQELSVTHEEALSSPAGELPGKNTVYCFRQYVPLPLSHQGLALTTVLQRQSGMLSYSRDMSIPRGYQNGYLNTELKNNLLFSVDWRFPISFPDTGLGLVAWHMYLISGTLFADCGAGWDGMFEADDWIRQSLVSVGGSVMVQGDMGVWLPIEAGVSAGYKTRERSFFTELLFSLRL